MAAAATGDDAPDVLEQHMSFNPNVQLDTSRIEPGGGGGGGGLSSGGLGGIRLGGGIGGVVVLIVVVLFQLLGTGGTGGTGGGVLPSDASRYDTSRISTDGQVGSDAFAQCTTGADANRDDICRIVATVNSAEQFWAEQLPRYGTAFRPAKTVIYEGTTRSACGTASNQVGPFYCPLDENIYIDASFFTELTSRYGADAGALAKEYVVAHEYGHHVQNILGNVLPRAQQDPRGPESGAVRIELMADCLAGMWASHATTTTDAYGVPFMAPLSKSDIESALSAASAVGDDRIQKKTQGRVTPESWTHGSSQARQRWFMTGFQTESLQQCDTFSPASVT